MSIAANLDRVRSQIAAACMASRRDPSTVALMAVSKMHPVEAILEAYAGGQRLFGENRVQEAQEKAPQILGLEGMELHLIEVKLSHEESKHGLAPADLPEVLAATAALEHLEVCGLMTVPPWSEDAELARPYFQRLRQLRDDNMDAYPALTELSMGMSHDFAVAIEEGSTCVRIGTAIFGKRDYS
jgi:uncharacterized pyridoxal phosphate-containing UPF0001 family protein